MSVANLLTMPLARGLFRRAIAKAGTPRTPATAERIGTEARRASGRRCLQGGDCRNRARAGVLPAQALLRNELLARPDPAFWGEVTLSGLPWAPTVDGQTLPEPPMRPSARVQPRAWNC